MGALRFFAVLCVVALAFIGGVFVGIRTVIEPLHRLTDAHAANQGVEEQYPNHNIADDRATTRIAVVGDSISTSSYRPHAADAEYPFLLATALHASLTNLSVPGWETDAMIAHAVPIIPAQTNLVIYAGGTNDLIYTGYTALPRVDRVITAIRHRVPRAKLIIVGLRDFGKVPTGNIVAWNQRERAVAHSSHAVYVDTYSALPALDRIDFPDGVHPNITGARRLALLIGGAVRTFVSR
jgi:lysophospholipase L1-like esterase